MNYIKTYESFSDNLNPNFYKWFGDSKVLDNNGNPLICYHGTSDKFNIFDIKKSGDNYNASYGAFFFTDREKSAKNYAKLHSMRSKRDDDGYVIASYLKITNPYIDTNVIDYFGAVDKFDTNAYMYIRNAKERGQDGIIFKSTTGSLYVVFNCNQIKSITNDGSWDINDNNIYS
jgi:hypothetical protein